MSVPVADQDAALRFYAEVLGCELRTDVEVWPGARMVEVVPPGSSVSLVLLTPDSQILVASRLEPWTLSRPTTKYARLAWPAVQGRGKGLVAAGTSLPDLELLESKAFRSGVALLRYAITTG